MNLETFSSRIAEATGMPIAYHHFPVGEAPPLPFLVYYVTEDIDDIADDGIYYEITSVTLELYTDIKEPEIENKIKAFFAMLEIPFSHVEEWIDEEKMYMQVYDFEMGE